MAYRRRSSLYHLVSVPRQIWRHPNNRGRRLRRLAAALTYQVRKRLGVEPTTVPLGPDLRVIGDPSAGAVSNLVYFGKYFEYDSLRFCERYLRPGDHVVDGGANVGVVSLLFSRWVGDGGRVMAFEPAPHGADLLRRNLELNRVTNVDAVEAALGARAEQARIISDMDVSNQLVGDEPGDHPTETVDVVRLDDVLDDRDFALVKLDLEGGELDALRGARRLIARGRLPVILLEALDHQLRRLGGSRAEVLDLLTSHGYRFAACPGGHRLTFGEPAQGVDFLAIAGARVDEIEQRLDARADRSGPR